MELEIMEQMEQAEEVQVVQVMLVQVVVEELLVILVEQGQNGMLLTVQEEGEEERPPGALRRHVGGEGAFMGATCASWQRARRCDCWRVPWHLRENTGTERCRVAFSKMSTASV